MVLRLALTLDKAAEVSGSVEGGEPSGRTDAGQHSDRNSGASGTRAPAATHRRCSCCTAADSPEELAALPRARLAQSSTRGLAACCRPRRGATGLLCHEVTRTSWRSKRALGYHFQRHELLEQALTHSSQAREVEALNAVSGDSNVSSGDNEILEFLGDAVLGLVTSESLFHRFPGFQEGHLSKLRAHLVGQRHLLRVAEQLEIGHYMRLGRGEEKSGGRNKASLLVDCAGSDSGGALSRRRLEGGAGLHCAHDRRTGTGAHEAGDQRHPGDGFQVRAAGSAAGPRRAATGVRAGERRRSGAQEDIHGRGAIAAPDREFVGRAQGATKKRAEQEAARQVLEHLSGSAQASNPL